MSISAAERRMGRATAATGQQIREVVSGSGPEGFGWWGAAGFEGGEDAGEGAGEGRLERDLAGDVSASGADQQGEINDVEISRASNDDVYDLVIDVAAGQPTVDTIAERLRQLAT